jgi:predicted phage terminase large subunit-like protein
MSICKLCSTPTLPAKLDEKGVCRPCAKLQAKVVQQVQPVVKPIDPADLIQPETPALQELDNQMLEAEQTDRFNQIEEAKREKASREMARRHMLPFVMRFNPDYLPGWVHAAICQKLEQFSQDVADKKSPRLMLSMPPRSGKSELASKNFPSWHLGHYPKHEIIQATYSSDLALDFSRKIREQMKSKLYQGLFPTRVDPKSQALERWNTAEGGAYAAVGVRGPITGRGAHIGIIDDPVKDRVEAESEVMRQQVKDWYSSTFYTRLAPGGGVLVIMTRWHEDDLSGWLCKLFEEAEAEAQESGEWPKDADRWEIINFPAVAEEDEEFRKKGEALHPDRYPLDALMRIKRALLPRDWSALYQQRPSIADGDFFRRGDFKHYAPNECPPLHTLNIYAAWDQALGKKNSNDFTVCVIVGISRTGDIYVLHVLRGRWSSLEIIEKMIEVQDTWKPLLQGVEESMIEMAIEPVLIKITSERKKFIPYIKLKHKGQDKVARAQSIRARVEQGRVWLPREQDASWVLIFLNELMKFPGGKHDDQADAFAWIGVMILYYASKHEKQVDTTPKWMKRLKSKAKTGSGAMSA